MKQVAALRARGPSYDGATSSMGRTTAYFLCSWHHHRIHDHRYQADKLPNGDLRFHRRG